MRLEELFESEIVEEFPSTKEEVETAIKKHMPAVFKSGKYIINDDLSVRVKSGSNLVFQDFKGKNLPLKLESIPSDITINKAPNLETLEGMPLTAGHVRISGCPNLVSLKGMPEDVASLDLLYLPKVKSLEGISSKISMGLNITALGINNLDDIHNHIHQVGSLEVKQNYPGYPTIVSGGLGILLIVGPPSGIEWVTTVGKKKDELFVEIMEKYLKRRTGAQDVFECQEELINAGLERWATV